MRSVEVEGHSLQAAVEGEGEPTIVLVHGTPTNRQLWRDVVPRLSPHRRVIAPDLLGFGDSDKPADVTYDLPTLARHLGAQLDALGVGRCVLVSMDLGLLVSLHLATQRPDRVAGLVVFEGLFLPMHVMWPAMGLGSKVFKALLSRDWASGWLLANGRMARTFLEQGVVRKLSEQDFARYVTPLLGPGHLRRVWIDGVGPRQLGLTSSRPGDTVALIDESARWLESSSVPVLLLTAEPGLVIGPALVAEAKRRLPRLEVAAVGAGRHFLPEDQPEAIAREVLAFVQRLG